MDEWKYRCACKSQCTDWQVVIEVEAKSRYPTHTFDGREVECECSVDEFVLKETITLRTNISHWAVMMGENIYLQVFLQRAGTSAGNPRVRRLPRRRETHT